MSLDRLRRLLTNPETQQGNVVAVAGGLATVATSRGPVQVPAGTVHAGERVILRGGTIIRASAAAPVYYV